MDRKFFTLVTLIELLFLYNGFSQDIRDNYCSFLPEKLSILYNHKPVLESRISPFDDNRDYFIYISKNEYAKNEYAKNGYIEKWCVYNTIENKIIVIDSTLKSNYERIYFGFENDSLFGFDNSEGRYFRVIFPERTISYLVDSNKIRVFDKVRALRIIENKLEYKINKRYDLVCYDSRQHNTIIYIAKGNYNDSIVLKNTGGAKFESNIHWYSDNELLFVKGKVVEPGDFLDEIYYYNVKDRKEEKIKLRNKLFDFWDYKDGVILLSTDKGFEKAKIELSDGVFHITKTKSILWKGYDKEVSGLYAFFMVKNNTFLYKAETPDYNFDYFKLDVCK